MDRLLRDYKQEEGDPCSKLLETETLKRLEAMKAIIQSYDEDRESIVHGFGEVKYTADKYISMILSNVEVRLIRHTHPGALVFAYQAEVHYLNIYYYLSLQGVENQVKDVMDLLKLQEQLVMEQWGVRKTMAEHCIQYLELEQSANEVSTEEFCMH